MNGAAATTKIFLSHSHQDRAFVEKLAAVLKRHRISYWYSGTDIVGAQQWHDEIGSALAKCNWLLLVLTPAAVRSEWVKLELFHALDEHRYRKHIIPLLRKPCNLKKLSWTLNSFQRVDFTGNFDEACQQLFRIWNVEFKPASGSAGSVAKPKPIRKQK